MEGAEKDRLPLPRAGIMRLGRAEKIDIERRQLDLWRGVRFYSGGRAE